MPVIEQSRSRRGWKIGLGVAVVLVLAVGGGIFGAKLVHPKAAPTFAAGSSPSTAASPAPTRKHLKVVFLTTSDIASYLEIEGAPCAGYAKQAEIIGAKERAHCTVNGDDVVISTYAMQSDAEANWELMSTTLKGVSAVDYVMGDRWTLNSDNAAYMRKAADILGGEYRHADA